MTSLKRGLSLVFVAIIMVLAVVLVHFLMESSTGDVNKTVENETGNRSWNGLEYHGYFRVFDLFIWNTFGEELSSEQNLSFRDWSKNSAHIANAALQSNLIIVPHVVENPRAYFYDPSYVDACVENGFKIILSVHTLAKYIYFMDPRSCSDEERMDLFIEELKVYEEKFRRYKDDIIGVQIYDEPWVAPRNVTHQMLFDMCEAARSVLWNKPILVMFHRQGNTYSYTDSNGSVITYDEWAGRMPETFDIIGVDPYFYSYHDEQPPAFHHTGDQAMVESDVSWACSFGKPVMLVGQAYDPGSSPFFDMDNTDPELSIYEGFEEWSDVSPVKGWSLDGEGIGVTDLTSYHGQRSLLLDGGRNTSSAVFKFERIHGIRVSFRIAVDFSGSPSAWLTLGDEDGEPIRLGIQGRDLVFHDGARVEIINRSIDVSPSFWHSITIDANVDADRWTVWFDGDRQTRLPNAIEPSSLSQLGFISLANSTRVWIDELRVQRDWSHIPLNDDETMLYYEVAKDYPQVNMLMWWNYPHSFASSLFGRREEFHLTDIWAVQRRIWEMID